MRPQVVAGDAPAVMPPPTLSARLRLQTRAAHDRIEANPHFARLMAPDLTRPEYHALVARLFGHHAAAEAGLAGAAALLPDRLGLAGRLRRTALLGADLVALGSTPVQVAALPRCPGLALRRPEEAWGVLYVLEGSSLGGQVIARHLAQHLQIGPSTGASGMAPYGAETGALWRGFKDALDEAFAMGAPDHVCTRGALDAEAVIDAACQAFDRLDRWVAAWG